MNEKSIGKTNKGKIVESELPLVNKDGEFNAYNKEDLAQNVGHALKELHNQIKVKENKKEGVILEDLMEVYKKDLPLFESYKKDKSFLSEWLLKNIKYSLNNKSLGRKILNVISEDKIGEGKLYSIPKIKEVGYVIEKNKCVYIEDVANNEIEITSFSTFREADIQKEGISFLENMDLSVQKAILCREDLIILNMLRSQKKLNDAPNLNSFTKLIPDVFMNLRKTCSGSGSLASNCLFNFDLWNDILFDNNFATWFDPATKYSMILDGYMGNLMGVNLITDGYRHPDLKLLNPGEIIMLPDPKDLGNIKERQAVRSFIGNRFELGNPDFYILLEELIAFDITNPLGIVFGQRK